MFSDTSVYSPRLFKWGLRKSGVYSIARERQNQGVCVSGLPGSSAVFALLISGACHRPETCHHLSLHCLCQHRGRSWALEESRAGIESGPFLALELPAFSLPRLWSDGR